MKQSLLLATLAKKQNEESSHLSDVIYMAPISSRSISAPIHQKKTYFLDYYWVLTLPG